MGPKLKICGMKVPSNIAEVAALKPDYMGFIFYEKSKRYIGGLSPEYIQALPAPIKKTGVFVDATVEEVIARVEEYGLDAVQLHGAETPGSFKEIKDSLPALEIIKAFGVDEAFDFGQLTAYAAVVDYFLFDTKTPDHGGSGKLFDWRLLEQYTLDKPYFLSGGIGPEALASIKNITDPRLYAVDVNSRFELEPGLKDLKTLKEITL